ncbi:GNAT family N-acetyltransferase [Phreatobacter stygius]|uniref:GNAT family N-acetyltransferase n=1 Tax=Phreatobacter stygius TaxID=1940610 RepID=A0A4D7B3F0_9HYPH|nr:GNAT family N-acetyltransferase [Phreatobacter stygius]QCI65795.1 GNAT family N-acetyltransferase [Phreatobacter stygius]
MTDELTASGVIRKLMPWETALLCEHFLRLDPEARNCRFAAGVSDDTITGYADTALGPDALVHGFLVDGVLRGAAELRLLDDNAAEVAVTVEDAWRLTGVGTALFGRLLLTARNRGVRSLAMTCLPANRGMQRLAARFDGKITYASGDVFADVSAQPANPLSLWREAWRDGSSVAATVLDAQLNLLKRARKRSAELGGQDSR